MAHNKYQGMIKLDNGESFTMKELIEMTGKPRATINHRLDKNNHASYVLSREASPHVVTLSDGKMYTKDEMMEITGASRRCISNRLYRSKEIDYVLRPQRDYRYSPRIDKVVNSFNETYGDTEGKVFKLLFGKW